MKTFLSCLAVAAILFVAVGYWQGWISFESSADKTTIEVETKEIKEAADKAVDKSKDAIENAGEAIENAGDDLPKASEDRPQSPGEANSPSRN